MLISTMASAVYGYTARKRNAGKILGIRNAPWKVWEISNGNGYEFLQRERKFN